MPSIGSGDFARIGEEFFGYFVDLAGLRPHERVLDVGCGTGRMARPLTAYLDEHGGYEGFDVVPEAIAWCRKRITPRHPRFRFQVADIRNTRYNPSGRVAPSEYRFPFPGEAFDFVFLTSVFTHMLAPDMENYHSEIARVLRPGGRCLATCFLLNAEARRGVDAGRARFGFGHEAPGCRLEDREVPEAAVAYEEDRVRDFFRSHRLPIREPILHGTWSGRQDGLSFQDMILSFRPPEPTPTA